MQKKNIVAILAGGTGSRMGADKPKQFLRLGDSMVIEHTVKAFEHHKRVHGIVIVVHPDWQETMRSIALSNGWSKVIAVATGGKERYHSSLAAIHVAREIEGDVRLIIHDAARPLVSGRIIDEVVDALNNNEAVVVGLPSVDTIWEVQNKDSSTLPCVEKVPPRNKMYRAQTPQAFRLHNLEEAYEIALQHEGFVPTDDCGVYREAFPNKPIAVVKGDECNLKITDPNDLIWAEFLIKKRESKQHHDERK